MGLYLCAFENDEELDGVEVGYSGEGAARPRYWTTMRGAVRCGQQLALQLHAVGVQPFVYSGKSGLRPVDRLKTGGAILPFLHVEMLRGDKDTASRQKVSVQLFL